MNIFAFTGLVNGIFALSFGFFLIYKGYRDRINQLFFLMTAAIAMWSFGYWQWLSSTEAEPALSWIRFFSVGSIFIPIFYFHWVLELIGQAQNRRKFLYLIYTISFLLIFFSSSGLFIESVEQKFSFPFWPNPGPLYSFYLIFFYLLLVLYSFILLSISYKTSDELRKGQIFYVFLGAIFGFGGGATNFFLWYDVPIPPYGNFLVSLFPFFLGYAIIKHHLFNVRVIATELLVFSIWIFLLVRTIVAQSLQDRIIDGGLLVLVIFFGILLIRSVLHEVRQREEIQSLAGELQKANLELKKLDQLKSEFVSLASHQLRTPLTVIKGYISMIQEGTFGKVEDQLNDALRKIYISNETLINLVGDFLNLSRIESGKMKYMFEPMQIEEMIQSVYEEFKEVVKDKKIELHYNKPEKPLPKAMLDKDKFRQVVMNLVDNAIKYTPSGSATLKIEEENEKNILLSVADTGVGMSKEDLGGIFKRFTRGAEGSKVNISGLGLGLYLAKRIVSDHGGEIWATSDGVGKGSIFWVRIPARAEIKNESKSN